MIESGFIEFVKEWGYFAVFIGSIVEGESVVLVASALAAFGYLSIYKVFCVAFFTTIFADQLLFFVGYRVGVDFLTKRFPKFKSVTDRVFRLLKRMDTFFILAFRFIYGVRTVSPFVIGAAKIDPVRFIFLNIISGFCWACISCCLGFLVADVVMSKQLSIMPAVLIVTGAMIAISIVVGHFVKMKEK